MNQKLPKFEGKAVQAAALTVSGGKSASRVGALAFDEEVFIIARCRVKDVTHGDMTFDKTELFTRQHKLGANRIVILDPADGARMLEEAIMLADERFGVDSLFAGLDKAGKDAAAGGDEERGEPEPPPED